MWLLLGLGWEKTCWEVCFSYIVLTTFLFSNILVRLIFKSCESTQVILFMVLNEHFGELLFFSCPFYLVLNMVGDKGKSCSSSIDFGLSERSAPVTLLLHMLR